MSAPTAPNPALTDAQNRAVNARGNVLVRAGAGTGKTKTLVERCLHCLAHDRVNLDQFLVVTFTEAAAAELRHRLRRELEARAAREPQADHWRRQLALFEVAHIGTLHSFCYQLVRNHFHELTLDPRLALLEPAEADELAAQVLDELLAPLYEGTDAFAQSFQALVRYQGGQDERLRALVQRIHDYSQTRADAAAWLATQLTHFSHPTPESWVGWFADALTVWHREWLAALEILASDNPKAAELVRLLRHSPPPLARPAAADLLANILAADQGDWPKRRKTVLRPPLKRFFEETEFLASLASERGGVDPLVEDWQWVRPHLATLVILVDRFREALADRKRADGVLDFHDLEQYALRLLWQPDGQPTPIALEWRSRLRFLFVDEYQDINAAQDRILAGLASHGEAANRFLVGDVKQSIYRFRLADPEIFRRYNRTWRAAGPDSGEVVFLTDNFRSCAGVLDFVNALFALILHPDVGGVGYEPEDHLQFGAPVARSALAAVPGQPRVELLLQSATIESASPDNDDSDSKSDAHLNSELADLNRATREARALARRLRQLVDDKHPVWDDERKDFRCVEFGDIAVLLRSPRGKADIYAREFARLGLPLEAPLGGFFDTAEIFDVTSLLQLLDNPLQDVPCLAVLRSPFGGFSLTELVQIRLAAPGKPIWTALQRAATTVANQATRARLTHLLTRLTRWRRLVRRQPLADTLSQILTEAGYLAWCQAQAGGDAAVANLRQFLHLAAQFDQRQRPGLPRFLELIRSRREADAEPVSPPPAGQAIRLLSIHKSKGLEFPVVAVPDLSKGFNEKDLHADILFDEYYGLSPRVRPPGSRRHYPSLPAWLARRRQRRELRGEELRLLYVALTRARDTLILSATLTEKKWLGLWSTPAPVTVLRLAEAGSYADWLGFWFANQLPPGQTGESVPRTGQLPQLNWRWLTDADLAGPNTPLTDIALGPEVSSADLLETDQARLTDILTWQYPHTAATHQNAKTTVTSLRRAAEGAHSGENLADLEARLLILPANSQLLRRREKSGLSAAAQGVAHHKFIQHTRLDPELNLADPAVLAAEADRLASGNFLTPDERAALELTTLTNFWATPLGKDIRSHAKQVRRELAFTARFDLAEIATLTGQPVQSGLEGEFMIVQGAADLVVLLPEELWLLDFKTDHFPSDALAERVRIYTPQLRLYAAALARIYRRPVTRTGLHFLALGKTVTVSP